MKLLFVRHGETKGNIESGVYGRTDYPLTEKGEKEAHNSKKLIDSLTEDVTSIYSSGLTRARQTANIIRPNKNVKIDERFTEFDFGIATEYPTLQEFKQDYPDAVETQNDRYPNGESSKEMLNRVVSGLNDIVKNHNDSDTIIIITHGGPMFCLFEYIENYDFGEAPYINTSECVEIKYDGGEFRIISRHYNHNYTI
jgi:broad specificity phosphatase PhoE